jgi:hypothetical protein
MHPHEGGHIKNVAIECKQLFTLIYSHLECLERNLRKILVSPEESLLFFLYLFILHFDQRLFNIRRMCPVQIIGLTEMAHELDGPFGGIVVVPGDAVSVVLGELMVEVVVSFAHRQQRQNEVASRSDFRCVVLGAKVVGNRIDRECRMPNQDPGDTSTVEESAAGIIPRCSSSEGK